MKPVLPRKRKVNAVKKSDANARVCRRLSEIRVSLGFTQKDFSDQVRIPRIIYANYEGLRTPLPCDVALKICRQFIISEKWLAMGEGLKRPCRDLYFDPKVLDASMKEPFATAFPRMLSKRFDEIDSDPFFLLIQRLNRETVNIEFRINLNDYLLECLRGCLPVVVSFQKLGEVTAVCTDLVNKMLLDNERDPRVSSNWLD